MLLDNNLLQNVVHDSWKINPMLYFKGMLTFEIEAYKGELRTWGYWKKWLKSNEEKKK